MWFLGDLDATFPSGPLWTIKHEEGKKRFGEEFRKPKEYQAQLRILALSTTFSMEKPDALKGVTHGSAQGRAEE